MRKKRISSVVVLLICLCLMMSMVAGCGSGDTDTDNKDAEPQTVTLTDSAKRQVEVPAEITRIVPSGTLAQIALFALAPDKLVGISTEWGSVAEQYLDDKYTSLPVVGQFYGQADLNLEEIAKIDPQVVIDVGEPKPSIVEDMDGITEQVGIPTVHITATAETMGDAYRMLGELLGMEEEAKVLAEYCEDVYSNTNDIMGKVGDDKVDLVYCNGTDGLNVIAQGSFHAEIINLVSNNVAVAEDISSKGAGNPVDMEQLVLWDPDVIIFAPDGIYDTVADDPAWQKLTAIKNGNYYEVPMGPYNWMGFPPSVNRYMGMIWITQLLYPDQAQCDVQQEATKYYDLFYHSELTEDQYKDLVANSLLKAEQ
ncbi:MAG: ABC transporter substrate-binding protein [Syntrophaceticus sp.]|nr:ABC transporter substrate-binding protein [Syntrophaceticus sp.]